MTNKLEVSTLILRLILGITFFVHGYLKFAGGIEAIVMIGAIFTAKLAGGFLGNGAGAGYELDLVLLAIAVVIVMNGSNLLSVDQLISKKKDSVSENI